LTSDTHGVSRSVERAAADPATWAVETTMFRALAVLRFVVLVFAITTTLVKWDGLERPGVAGFALAVMTGWTGFTTWAYDEPRRRRPPLLVADLVIAVAMVLLTVVVQSDAQLTGNLSTLPSFWVMAVVLAWGIHWHWVGGLIASAAVSVADIAIRPEITQTNVGNIFLLMVGGPVIGYTTGLLKEMAGARDRAERAAAAAAERARLARVVHDGVLQVLSLVQRRGLELGGEAADLGRLAGEQEVALRALVQQGESSSFGISGDLARSLASLQSRTVTVSVPGSVVLFPSAVVEEVTAVVRACLSNVEVHVGPDAPAWVLLEDLGSSVIVTVRDEGPGIPSGRLEDAAAEGRLGVRESIRGRVTDLGGTATLVTAPGQGTEWELTFPKA
jgi:signal transduction histidine kinase